MPALRAPPSQPKEEEAPALAPLNERIAALRAEIDAFIDALAEKEKCAGVPLQVTRNLLTARGGACQCRQYLINTRELK